MKKVGFIIIGLLIGFFLSLLLVSKGYSQPTYEEMVSHTVLITGTASFQVETDEGIEWKIGKRLGTGWVVYEDSQWQYIVTNSHVIGYSYDRGELYQSALQVRDEIANSFIFATLIDYSKVDNIDVALIRIPNVLRDKKPVKGFAVGKITDKVYVVGHHLGSPYTYGEGVIANYEYPNLFIQVPILSGNSGSAVFNENGDVIGIVYAGKIYFLGEFPGFDVAHGLVVDYIDITNLLTKNGIPFEVHLGV